MQESHEPLIVAIRESVARHKMFVFADWDANIAALEAGKTVTITTQRHAQYRAAQSCEKT